jgi:hypothetical protein
MNPKRWQLNAWLVGGALAVAFALAAHALRPAATVAGQAAPSPVTLRESMEGGLHGYIKMKVSPPPDGFGYGVSFYAAAWPLLARPLKSFQIGLPGTWIIPDNRDYQQPLCPPGTEARDHWIERAPTFYRDVFQTIEGGMGFWTSNQFHSTTPKFIMNATANCYNYMIETPGFGFGPPSNRVALSSEKMGLVQLSNRLVVPPDAWTFKQGMHGELFGTAWMALPLMDPYAAYHRQPTGDLSWTLFVNAANFKGLVAFWIPDMWSAIANGYPPAAGRTLDVRPGVMAGGAMEVNTVPYFSNRDAHGVLYSRIPQLLFPVSAKNTTVLMQDVMMYSPDALYKSMKTWSDAGGALTGAFDPRGAITPSCANLPLKFDQDKVPMTGFQAFVETTMVGQSGSCSFGLKWKGSPAGFPQYFQQDGNKMVAINASQVPPETALASQNFAPPDPGKPYTSPTEPGTVWTNPGPKSAPITAVLSDGSQITYCWYRFVDQPALQHLHLSEADKSRLQAMAERIQANWPITRNYMAPPSSGALATLDSAIIVTPPRGMEVGYVPILTRQESAPAQHH